MERALCLGLKHAVGMVREGGILHIPDIAGCSHNRRRVYQVFDPWRVSPDTWRSTYHKSCMHNEVTGLVGRVLSSVPAPTEGGMASLRKRCLRLGHWLRAHSDGLPLSYEEVIKAYSGLKRTRYERARRELMVEPVSRRDAGVVAFVKAEKRPYGDRKDPRIIQMRKPRYTLEVARHVRPLERALKAYKGDTRVDHRSKVIAKGLTTWEHAELIAFKWGQFKNPVCISLDARRFDKHVGVEALRCEHLTWTTANRTHELAQLLSWQLKNVGRTRSGIRYAVNGNRMSGDFNTGCGNCVIMSGMIEAIMLPKKVPFDFLVNSDDALIFVEAEDLPQLQARLPTEFLAFGQEVELEEPAYRLEDIVHCQHKMLRLGTRWRMVRDFRKVISQAFVNIKHYHEPRGGMRVMKSVAQCELTLAQGVPIIQPFFERVLVLLDHLKFAKLDEGDNLTYRVHSEVRGRSWELSTPTAITPEARAAFHETFGILPDKQIAIEEGLSAMSFSEINLEEMDRTMLCPRLYSECLDA